MKINFNNHNVVPFDFKGTDITVITDQNNEPWWIAKEVCDVLGIKNPTTSIMSLDHDEKMKLRITEFQSPGRGGDNGVRTIINEPGLYSLIFRSKKRVAKVFKRWVTHEVLPQIRKTGSYVLDEPLMEKLKTINAGYELALGLIEEQTGKIEDLEQVIVENQDDLDVLDDLMDNGDTLTMTSAAKVLGIGRNKFHKQLHDLGMIFKQFNWGCGQFRSGAWVPKQSLMDRGFFIVKMKPFRDGYGYRPQTYITPEGLRHVSTKLAA